MANTPQASKRIRRNARRTVVNGNRLAVFVHLSKKSKAPFWKATKLLLKLL